MLIEEIEKDLKKFSKNINKERFIFDFLKAYQVSNTTLSRLEKGDHNLSKTKNELIWKKKLLFNYCLDTDLHLKIDEYAKNNIIQKYSLRFLIIINNYEFLAMDIKTKKTLDIKLTEVYKHFKFFLPLVGLEKSSNSFENLADIKAAEKMGQLFDVILEDDIVIKNDKKKRHNLNIFFSRLLFCFFSDDAGIFPKNEFKNSILSYADGNEDFNELLAKIFETLGSKDRKNLPTYLINFPYVNGGLFNNEFPIPKLSSKARKIIIQCAELNWKLINPDILGSMMQAVVSSNERSNLGMHYTSVENITKVIQPLFLDSILEDFNNAEDDEKKLKKVLIRIYNLIIIDPACGSGNFLIITYKELCKIEMNVYKKLQKIDKVSWSLAKSGIRLNQFYGIEIDDFAAESSKVSLWIIEHQMNLYFKEVFGETNPTLPLGQSGNIICDNATRVDWENIFIEINRYKKKPYEIYILGNPPYKGYAERNDEQKKDIEVVFGESSKLDYISIWFIKAAKFIRNKNAKFAFVTTNSIHQGEQVNLLWPKLLSSDLEIFFSNNSFKWNNNAKYNAGVICSIIGVCKKNKNKKKIFSEGLVKEVHSINPYLSPGENVVVASRKKPLSNFPTMTKGDIAYDGGFLSFTAEDKLDIINKYPDIEKYFRRFVGASDSIRGITRWCLWVNESEYKKCKEIPELQKRFDLVEKFRLSSKRKTTSKMANKPYRFIEIRKIEKAAIIVPVTSSSRRVYIPINFADSHAIINASNQAIYNSEVYMFSILSSIMNMIWVKTVGGRMKNDYRYSAEICYNTFPFPLINNDQKNLLKKSAQRILDLREKFSEMNIAEIYDPKYMPKLLLEAHKDNDLLVEKCYTNKAFLDNNERLEYLLKMYKNMNELNLSL